MLVIAPAAMVALILAVSQLSTDSLILALAVAESVSDRTRSEFLRASCHAL